MYVLELTKGRAWHPCLLGKTQPPVPRCSRSSGARLRPWWGRGWSWRQTFPEGDQHLPSEFPNVAKVRRDSHTEWLREELTGTSPPLGESVLGALLAHIDQATVPTHCLTVFNQNPVDPGI